jgi:oligoribonuclease NrnB/cAMP/cGMP phosphodiesterase (DHH superfamily)
MKQVLILYHNNCPDGFAAAWAARKKFGSSADYLGVEHQTPPPLEEIRGKEVYLLDFSYPEEKTIESLTAIAANLVIIDHHLTFEAAVKKAPEYLYDLNHSGAILAWRYFHGATPPPALLRYIEDFDLWQFNLPDTKKVMALFGLISFDFGVWDKIVAAFENEQTRAVYLERGAAILEYQERIIERLLREGEEVIFEGYSALAVNSPILQSQTGNAIIQKGYQIGIVWSYKGDETIKISLRSAVRGGVNVGELAKKYGGGGHWSAAGFKIKSGTKLPWQRKN